MCISNAILNYLVRHQLANFRACAKILSNYSPTVLQYSFRIFRKGVYVSSISPKEFSMQKTNYQLGAAVQKSNEILLFSEFESCVNIASVMIRTQLQIKRWDHSRNIQQLSNDSTRSIFADCGQKTIYTIMNTDAGIETIFTALGGLKMLCCWFFGTQPRIFQRICQKSVRPKNLPEKLLIISNSSPEYNS